MKKLFEASFEQIDPAISESFVKNSLDTAKNFKGLKLIAFFILFVIAGSYALFGVSIYVGNRMDEAVGGLDVHNEFIPLFSSLWYVHLQILPMLIAIFSLLFYRNKNRMKGMVIHNFFVGIFMLFFSLLAFKLLQLFVNPFPLRLLYTGLFIFTFVYSFHIGYHNAKVMVFGKAKQRPFLVEWTSRNSKRILSVLAVLGSLYFAAKAVWPNTANMEQRIIGSMADFLPLLVVLSNFAILYYISTSFRGYYVHRYSEQFRNKYEYDPLQWYGCKYKG